MFFQNSHDAPPKQGENIFDPIFWKSISAGIFEEEEKGEEQRLFFGKLKEYLEEIYDICKNTVPEKLSYSFKDDELDLLEKVDVTKRDEVKNEIGKFLKVMEDGSSYSALVNT